MPIRSLKGGGGAGVEVEVNVTKLKHYVEKKENIYIYLMKIEFLPPEHAPGQGDFVTPLAKEVMFLVALVCLFVCLYVCLWTTLLPPWQRRLYVFSSVGLSVFLWTTLLKKL